MRDKHFDLAVYTDENQDLFTASIKPAMKISALLPILKGKLLKTHTQTHKKAENISHLVNRNLIFGQGINVSKVFNRRW